MHTTCTPPTRTCPSCMLQATHSPEPGRAAHHRQGPQPARQNGTTGAGYRQTGPSSAFGRVPACHGRERPSSGPTCPLTVHAMPASSRERQLTTRQCCSCADRTQEHCIPAAEANTMESFRTIDALVATGKGEFCPSRLHPAPGLAALGNLDSSWTCPGSPSTLTLPDSATRLRAWIRLRSPPSRPPSPEERDGMARATRRGWHVAWAIPACRGQDLWWLWGPFLDPFVSTSWQQPQSAWHGCSGSQSLQKFPRSHPGLSGRAEMTLVVAMRHQGGGSTTTQGRIVPESLWSGWMVGYKTPVPCRVGMRYHPVVSQPPFTHSRSRFKTP